MRIQMFALVFLSQCQQTSPIEAAFASLSQDSIMRTIDAQVIAPTEILLQSEDGGTSWQDVSDGLPPNAMIGRALAFDGNIYLATNKGLYSRSASLVSPVWNEVYFLPGEISNLFEGKNGPYISSYNEGFYQQMPGTSVYTLLSENLKDKSIRTVLEAKNGDLLVGSESGICKSSDHGKAWKQVLSGTGINNLVESGDVLYSANFGGIMRSMDGGEHWDWVCTESGDAFRMKPIPGGAITLTQIKDPKSNIWINGMAISTDDGKSWQPLAQHLPEVKSINDVAQVGEYIFCSTDLGVFRSGDLGKSWQLVYTQLSENSTQLQFVVSGKMLYLVRTAGC